MSKLKSNVYRLVVISCSLVVASAAAQVKSNSAIVKDFNDRINKYESLKKNQSIPNKQSNSAEVVTKEKHQAAQKLQNARPAARQGDIFTPAIAAYFKRQIQATLHGPGGTKVQQSLRHAEPLPAVHLQVNERYPQNLPLQSTPPTLLQNLPQLPKGLQYRVVGSTLLIYDEASNLIVDLIPGAVA
jgi:hypothetical protein